MPVLKHAKKKLRQDKRRTLANKKVKDGYKKLFKAAVKAKTADSLSKAFQAIDKAAKQNILHANKAARLKSSLSKLVPAGSQKSTAKSAAVKTDSKKATSAKKTPVKASAKSAKK